MVHWKLQLLSQYLEFHINQQTHLRIFSECRNYLMFGSHYSYEIHYENVALNCASKILFLD